MSRVRSKKYIFYCIMSFAFIIVFLILMMSFIENKTNTLKDFSTLPPKNENILNWTLIERVPHNPKCFTQGLEMLDESRLFESCGLYGESLLYQYNVDMSDESKTIMHLVQELHISSEYFAEGLTFDSEKQLHLLTWRENKRFVYSIQQNKMMTLKDTYNHEHEGWGIAFNPITDYFYTTNGSNYISVFANNKKDGIFKFVHDVPVSLNGENISNLNELEYDRSSGLLYINVWYTNIILCFDPEKKYVVGILNMSSIAMGETGGVLNGIAKIPNTNQFWITGKNWRSFYRVKVEFP